MKHQSIKYISATVVITFAALFRILLLWFSYWSIQLMNEKVDPAQRTSTSVVINFVSIFPIIILFAEAVLYVVLRKRFFYKRLVRIHLWMTIVSSVIFPVVQYIGYTAIPFYYSPNEIQNVFKQFDWWGMTSGWTLFAITRLFFIAAMVKSVTSLNEQKDKNESTGLLDDFAQ